MREGGMGRGRDREGREWSGVIAGRGVREGGWGLFTHQARGCLVFFCEEACLYVGARLRSLAVVLVRARLFSFMGARLRMCVVVSVCAGLFSNGCRWVGSWAWMCCGRRGPWWWWCGRRGRMGRGGRGHRGCGGSCPRPRLLLLLLVGYGGRCQSCDGKMGTELTYDGDDACCHHHLDDVAMPRRLPAHSAVGAGDMALPRCRHLMVRAVLVVGGWRWSWALVVVSEVVRQRQGGCRGRWWWLRKKRWSAVDGTKSIVGVCRGSFGKVKRKRYYID